MYEDSRVHFKLLQTSDLLEKEDQPNETRLDNGTVDKPSETGDECLSVGICV